MDKFCIKKSYRAGCVALRFSIKATGYNSLKVEGGSDLETAAARDLAKALIEAADLEDAKVAGKKASEERRKNWRDREVAAGRMKII